MYVVAEQSGLVLELVLLREMGLSKECISTVTRITVFTWEGSPPNTLRGWLLGACKQGASNTLAAVLLPLCVQPMDCNRIEGHTSQPVGFSVRRFSQPVPQEGSPCLNAGMREAFAAR